jgi:replication factor A1
MKISDLVPGTGNVELQAEVIEVEEPREIDKMGRKLRVSNVVLKDETGTIKLTLWNAQIDAVSLGCKVQVSNAYVNVFLDEPKLTLGKFGKIQVVP